MTMLTNPTLATPNDPTSSDPTSSDPTSSDPTTDESTSDDWSTQAACRSVANAVEVFFSDENVDLAAAKLICSSCPVIAPCLEGALTRGEAAGVWGGQLFSKGQVVSARRRRGRPPKVARPEDQLPEVPIPAHLQKLIA